MKAASKTLLHRVSQLIVAPLGLACWLEKEFRGADHELVFNVCAHFVALLPGLPGAFLRRAFYTQTLDCCAAHCHIGFGSIFSHRSARVSEYVYIGNYALIGSSELGPRALIGSRVSIISGPSLHELDDRGGWTPYSAERLEMVKIGADCWIGETAVISADIGEGSMVGAGAVVSTAIRGGIVVAGNPARFVRRLNEKTGDD